MKLPPDVLALLQRRFDSQHRDWLAAPDPDAWPLVVPLGVPSEQQARTQVEAVRQWLDSWRQWQGVGQVDWVVRQWKVLGVQRLPASVTFASADEVARCLGQDTRWARCRRRFALLTARWSGLGTPLARTFAAMSDYEDEDFERLLSLITWLLQHPASGLYPRQVPVEGLDSKWLEGRKALISELLCHLRPDGNAPGDFYAQCGLRRPPSLVRMRVLDAALRAQLGGLGDLASAPSALAGLAIRPSRVLVLENLQTGLSLPDLPGTVAIMGLGYGVDVLSELPWMAASRNYYWGDIDTHGFAILQRAREAVPGLVSVLMDSATLLAFQHLAGLEPVQAAVEQLPLLTAAEQATLTGLKSQQWGHHLRLEQERIPWAYVMQALAAHDQDCHKKGPLI